MLPVDQQPPELGWEAWSRGEGRCPYCVDQEWRDFVAMCDCFEVDREIADRAELRFLEVEALEDLMAEPAGGHNHGRKKTESGWSPLETSGAASDKHFVEPRIHGTSYTASKIGCGCDLCKKWRRDKKRRQRGSSFDSRR